MSEAVMPAVIHLYEVRASGVKFYAHCTCQYESKPVRSYDYALKRGLLHVQAQRRK